MALMTKRMKAALLLGCAGAALAVAMPAAAAAEGERQYAIGSMDLDTALREFAMTSGHDVVFDPAVVRGRKTAGVSGSVSDEAALRTLLQGTELAFEQTSSGGFVVRAPRFQRPADADASGGAEVEALIVTAQKREEDIQDVPIAISAFTQEALERSQIAGGPDLITQVPNMAFTKTNFSSYSIQIRGIGTQAISATVDPAVAVAFNNTPFIRNRFFEQEFYDLQRVEVLRGPQGTLYGRNATAGVVNIISAKPKFGYEAKASGDVANFNSTRIEGMVNIPLVEDKAALRLAGAWTKRDGFATNELIGNPIDGRDLWSTRLSLRLAPTDRLDVNLVWEHFEEDDDRLRSGKQLCKTDVVTEVAGMPVDETRDDQIAGGGLGQRYPGLFFSQGCQRNSLYDTDSFQTPDGVSLPYYFPLSLINLPAARIDPFVSRTQSQDLRVIESTVDPTYKAKSDVVELQLGFDLSDRLAITSETAFSRDTIFSSQDYNRFNTASGAWSWRSYLRPGVLEPGESGDVFCDPQIGCADRLVAVDLSTAESTQFSQEFRLASDYTGPFNFSLGANFLRYDTVDKYYVFINSLSLLASLYSVGRLEQMPPYVGGVSDNSECMNGFPVPDPSIVQTVGPCNYIDPNPIGSLNDLGHNYFLSKNPYKLISYAVFGEAYYQVNDALKLTAGLRWTVDKKEAPRIPSWVLASKTAGYPVTGVVEQEWREPTGRLTLDWKPDLSFTDETMLYASYAHGYKAGGSNPPPTGPVMYCENCGINVQVANKVVEQSLTHPKHFDPEFVDAFELGAKNSFFDGAVTLNLAGFYYDYQGYQISEIVNRSAVNRNFDAEVWGFEAEADWRPLENLRLGFKGGYEKTRIADGQFAIDLMDRTAGDPDWTVVRPFPTFTANCILPTALFSGVDLETGLPTPVSLGGMTGGNPGACELAYVIGFDPVTAAPYVADPDPNAPQHMLSLIEYFPGYEGWDPSTAPNGGEGIAKDVSGNELPNAPQFTATITADYTVPLSSDWLATFHTDLHWQSESWWRVFQDHEYARLDDYFTMNLAAIFTNEERGWHVMAYVKNVTDETAITGAFLNSDDTGLPTNVFLTEPRLYGLRVTKQWTGGPLLGGLGERRDGPYPFTVELGGHVQRHDASYERIRPAFAGAFSPTLDIFEQPQGRDLDWGDGREVKLVWRPSGGALSLRAGYRRGDSNNDTARAHAEEQTPKVCMFAPPIPQAALCNPSHPQYQKNWVKYATNWSEASARSHEEHEVLEFAVGHDVGFGALDRAAFSVGLRHAQLESVTDVMAEGIPDWNIPVGFIFPSQPVTHTRRELVLGAEREFSGVGPVVELEAAKTIWGADDTGRLDLDWKVSAGVLFGEQDTTLTGLEETSFYNKEGSYPTAWSAPDQVVPTLLETMRSNSATVPTVGVDLGLSYGIDRLRLSAGYRWERYYDVLDVGAEERKDADRTIDGPYFKVAVGFGG